MATIRRIYVPWGGIPALNPGVSVFYSSAAADAITDLGNFFFAVKALFPTGLSWTLPPVGDTIDDTTGAINGQWTSGSGGISVATGGTTAYAAGVGAYINWKTGAIVGRRRLAGRTFLVPLLGNNYDSNGTLTSGSLGVLAPAAATLAGAGKLVIWHRPRPGGTGGSSALVTAGTIPDQVTSLRTRRR